MTADADRTLPPSERHRREARLRGVIGRSSELNSAIVLLAGSSALWWFGADWATALASMMRRSLSGPPVDILSVSVVSAWSWQIALTIGRIVLPVGLIVFSTAVLANLVQAGWLWIPSKLANQLRFQSLISTERSIDAIGMILRLTTLGTVTWWFLTSQYGQLSSIGLGEPTTQFSQLVQLIGDLLSRLSAGLLLLAILDYGIRFWRNEQQLRMTVEERRREEREESIDPRFKKARQSRPPVQTPV